MGLISDGRWEKDVWEGSPLPQAPRAKRFRRVGWGGVDEIDVIFLGAWWAAPVELRGSRTRVGRYRRRRRGTPNADDNLACAGMKIGFVAVSRVFWEWPDSCHLEGVNRCSSGGRETAAATAARGAEMGAFGRASDRLRPRGDGERIPPSRGEGGCCRVVPAGAVRPGFD